MNRPLALTLSLLAQHDEKQGTAALEPRPLALRYQAIDRILADRLEHAKADFARSGCVTAHEVLIHQGAHSIQ